jgi:transcription-repair coupling factor (superfamily II helicase)
VQLNLGISLRIDADYIEEENQRLRMYKRIAGAENASALADVRDELVDRYGELPDSVKNLLAAGELRLLCENVGVAQADRKRVQVEEPVKGGGRQKVMREMLHLRFTENANIDPAHLMQMVARHARRGAQFSPQGVLKWPVASSKAEDVIAETRSLLESLGATEAVSA